jgi:sugar-phosphatase
MAVAIDPWNISDFITWFLARVMAQHCRNRSGAGIFAPSRLQLPAGNGNRALEQGCATAGRKGQGVLDRMSEIKRIPGNYEAYLFDMDGTLLTSIPVVERVWSDWAKRVGVPFADVLAYLHGRRGIDTVSHFAPPHVSIAEETAWVEAQEIADVNGVAPIAGALELLTSLRPDQWAVVTSASRALALRRLEAAGLPLPQVLITSDDVQNGKPDPEGFLLAASRLGVDIKRCLVFEDADAGLRAGLAAGAQVVRLSGPHGASQSAEVPTISDYIGLRLGNA